MKLENPVPIAPHIEVQYVKNPQLPPPEEGWLPTINIARAKGWPAGEHPKAGEGLKVDRVCQITDRLDVSLLLGRSDVMEIPRGNGKRVA